MVVECLLMLFGFQLILLVHELAHAAVGKVAGIRNVEVIIGVGRKLLRWRGIEWRVLPIGGRCRFDAESHNKLTRSQKAAIALAGPGSNLMLAWLLMIASAPASLIQVSLILGVINLIPLPRTDGWQALMQWINSPQLAEFAVNPWVVEGVLAICAVWILL